MTVMMMTPTDLDILLVTLFTWSLNVRFSYEILRNFLLNRKDCFSNAFFWLDGDHHI